MAVTPRTSYNCYVNSRILPVTMNRSLIVYIRGATIYTFQNTFLTTLNLNPSSAIELTPYTILQSRESFELFLWEKLINMNLDPHLCDLAAPQIVSTAINAAAARRGLGFQLEATLNCQVNLNDSSAIRTPSRFFSYASENLNVEEEGVPVLDDEGTGQMGLGPEPRGVSEKGVFVLEDEGLGHMPKPRGVSEEGVLVIDDEDTGPMSLGLEPRGVSKEGVLVLDDEGMGHMGLGPKPRGVSEKGVLVLDDEGPGHMALGAKPRGVSEAVINKLRSVWISCGGPRQRF